MLGMVQHQVVPCGLRTATHRPLRPPPCQSVVLRRRRIAVRAAADTEPLSYARDITKPRFVQHKTEAFWFYRFLSIVYDHIVNPGHWTIDMRTDALEPARLDDPNLKARVTHVSHTHRHTLSTHRWWTWAVARAFAHRASSSMSTPPTSPSWTNRHTSWKRRATRPTCRG